MLPSPSGLPMPILWQHEAGSASANNKAPSSILVKFSKRILALNFVPAGKASILAKLR